MSDDALDEQINWGSRWRVRQWEEGAVAYHLPTGDTHALDLLTAQVLGALIEGVGSQALVQALAQHLGVLADEHFTQAVCASVQVLTELGQR